MFVIVYRSWWWDPFFWWRRMFSSVTLLICKLSLMFYGIMSEECTSNFVLVVYEIIWFSQSWMVYRYDCMYAYALCMLIVAMHTLRILLVWGNMYVWIVYVENCGWKDASLGNASFLLNIFVSVGRVSFVSLDVYAIVRYVAVYECMYIYNGIWLAHFKCCCDCRYYDNSLMYWFVFVICESLLSLSRFDWCWEK